MNRIDEFNNVYLDIIKEENEKILSESFGKNLAIATLAGTALLGCTKVDAESGTKNTANNLNKPAINQQVSNQQQSSQINKSSKPIQQEIVLSDNEEFIAKTIYSEASTLCSYEEHIAIGRVIQNRIGHKGFGMGRLSNAFEVCKQPKAFTSVLKHNVNWDQYQIKLNKFSKFDAQIAKILMDPSKRLGGSSWMKDIVYYHDKSIKKPSSWDNRYWKAILVKETEHFKFYKIEENKKPIKRRKRK